MQTYKHTYKYLNIQIYKHTIIQTYKHTDIQTYKHTNIQTYKHTSIQTYIHTYIHTDIQTYRHTNIQTYRHTSIQTYQPPPLCTSAQATLNLWETLKDKAVWKLTVHCLISMDDKQLQTHWLIEIQIIVLKCNCKTR